MPEAGQKGSESLLTNFTISPVFIVKLLALSLLPNRVIVKIVVALTTGEEDGFGDGLLPVMDWDLKGAETGVAEIEGVISADGLVVAGALADLLVRKNIPATTKTNTIKLNVFLLIPQNKQTYICSSYLWPTELRLL